MNTEKPVTILPPVRPFSKAHKATLNALMNLMVPASSDGTMPAAASLGLFDDLRSLPQTVRDQFERGLDALATQAANQHDKPFAELAPDDANKLVQALRSVDPAFLSAFTLHTTARYLQHDRTMEALGLEPRPHWPMGHEVAQGDWGLLEPVRQRGPVWREV